MKLCRIRSSEVLLAAGCGLAVLTGCQVASVAQAPAPIVTAMRDQAQPAPPWLVGQYSGAKLNSELRNIELSVEPDGRLVGKVAGVSAEGQYIGNGRVVWSHGNESMIDRMPNGFRMVQAKNPGNVTEYFRK